MMEQKFVKALNRFSKLGFATLVKHDFVPKTTTFAPCDEN